MKRAYLMKEKFLSFLAHIIRDHIVYLFLIVVLIIVAVSPADSL